MPMLLKIILLGNQNENLEIPPSSAVFSLCNIDSVHTHTKTKCFPFYQIIIDKIQIQLLQTIYNENPH